MNGLTLEKARAYRKLIEKAVQSLEDSDALECVTLYEKWSGDGVEYKEGKKVRYNNILYVVKQAHISQPNWTPDTAVSLFAKVLIPDTDVIPEWEQPESTNPYMKGDKVKCDGKIWVSSVDNNVWKPGVYGWDEVAE